MTPEVLFRVGGQLAVVGWLALVFAGRYRFVGSMLCKFVIPGLIAVLYTLVIGVHWAGHAGGFGSLAAVQQLFSSRWLLAAGWLHYLAFDLFVGAWEVREAERLGIGHGWLIPCLVLTFLFGPAGYLLFLVLAGIWGRRRVPAGAA